MNERKSVSKFPILRPVPSPLGGKGVIVSKMDVEHSPAARVFDTKSLSAAISSLSSSKTDDDKQKLRELCLQFGNYLTSLSTLDGRVKSFTHYPNGATFSVLHSGTLDEATGAIRTGWLKFPTSTVSYNRIGNAIRLKECFIVIYVIYNTAQATGNTTDNSNDKGAPRLRAGLFIDKYPPLNPYLPVTSYVDVLQAADSNNIQALYAGDQTFSIPDTVRNMSGMARFDILSEHHHQFQPSNIAVNATLSGATTLVQSLNSQVHVFRLHYRFPGRGMLVQYFSGNADSVASNLLGSYIMTDNPNTGTIVYQRQYGQVWFEDEQDD